VIRRNLDYISFYLSIIFLEKFIIERCVCVRELIDVCANYRKDIKPAVVI